MKRVSFLKSIIFLSILFISTQGTVFAQLSGFSNRIKYTVDNTKVSQISETDLTNFPVLISITNASLIYNATLGVGTDNINGYDIAFTSADGITQLDHELESYNSGTGQILAWVRFPTLNATTNTDFFIYYGNAFKTTNPSLNSTWDSNYQMVLHMNTLNDATSYANDGTNNGSGGGTTSTTGKIGNARNFNRNNNDFITVADDVTLDITGDITLSSWINIDNFADVPDLITKGDYTESYATWIRGDGTLRFADDGTTRATTTSTIGSGTTVYVTFTNSATETAIFINGVSDVTGAAASFTNTTNPLNISTTTYPLNGWVDEVRISNVVRSADWINTEYLNQDSPGTFVSQIPDPPVLADLEATPLNVFSGGGAVPISSTLTITHPFTSNLTSATIQITANYDAGNDLLNFTPQNGITGSFVSGTLTLSGSATLAQYQTAIRSITFGSTSSIQTVRTISITANDGSNDTNTETRDVNIITVLSDLSTDFPNTVFHYDAQDINGDLNTGNQPANGALITNWIDRSLNAGGSAAEITNSAPGGDQPIFNSNYFGERGALLFDSNGGNNGDNFQVNDDGLLNTNGPYNEKSFAAVFRTGNDLSGLQIIYEQGGSGNGYQISIKNGFLYAFAWSGNAGWVDGANQSINLGQVEANTSYIVIANHNATTTTWEANVNGGSLNQSSGAAGPMNNHGGDATIGEEDGTKDPEPPTFASNPANTNNFNGYIAELGSWNTALSGGQIASVYNYLCDKWCNVAPLLSGIEGTPIDYNELDPPTNLTALLTVTDSDNNNLDSALVLISSNFQAGGEDQLTFSTAGTSITGNFNNTTGRLFFSGNDTKANYQTVLRSVQYENTLGNSPTPGVRQVDFLVYDWDDSSNVQFRNVNVISVNSTPSLSGITGNLPAFVEGAGPVSPTFSATITDLDDINMESATISITNNYEFGEDELSFTDTGNITGSWASETGILTLSGTATLSEYETALESIVFNNTSSDPIESTRTISFSVNDGITNSNTQNVTVSVTATNSAPVLINLESSRLAYPNVAVQITNTIEVSDPDDTTIDSASVIITGNFRPAEDSLKYSTLYGITGAYNASTGKLKLIGNSSFSDYQAALRSVLYKNYAVIATGPQREISFLVYDQQQAESDTVKRQIDVSPVETIPDLTVWLRADVGVVTSGAQVTTWQDQSGNNNDFVGTAGTGTRPTLIASSASLGSNPAINFAGNGDFFLDTDGENYINGLSEFTLFLVYKSDQTNTDRGLWIVNNPSGSDDIFTIRYDASGANNGGSFTNVIKTGILGNNAANQLESFSDIQSTNAQITSLHWDSNNLFDIYVDGILNNPSSAAAPPIGSISGADRVIVGKGGKDSGTLSWDGQIAEVILYGRSLSATERESVEDYLAVKFNSAIRKITAATGGDAISADDANGAFTSLTGPIIQEGFPGELTNPGEIVLTLPSGYRWNTSSAATVTIDAAYGGTTTLTASSGTYSVDSTKVTFTITNESSSNPGQIEFSGLQVRPSTGVLPNNGTITNTGTTGQGGGTNYGNLVMIPGNVDSLTFIQQPTITNVNSVITPSIRVQLVDQYGNAVTTAGTNVTMSIASGAGVLSGTTPVATNALGIASFDDLQIDNVGSHVLIATSDGLNSENSNSFSVVNAGTLTGFLVERVPSGNISNKTAGQTFNIKITAIDGTSTPVTTFNGTVVVTSSCSMGSGQGTTSSFTSGVLASHSVSITSLGNCTITVTNSSGSETGISNSFSVSPGAASTVTTVISASPTVILFNGGGTSTITVQLKDAFGNNLTSGSGTVALSATDGSLSPVTNNANGTYTATLTSSASLVTSTITGTLNAVAITDNAQVEFANFSHIWISQLGSPEFATNWDDATNWNVPSIPNASSVVLIPASPAVGNGFPVVDVNNTTISSLTIENGAEISVSGSINFIVTGDVTGDGNVLGSNNDSLTIGGNLNVPSITLGTVVFNGSSEQSILSPHSYVNLEVDNPTTLFANDDLTISGALTLTNGELLIPSGKNLISSTQSYGSGSLRFQRGVNGVRGWRMVSSPVSSTFGDFLDGTLTQGYTGATYSTGSFPGDTLQPNVFWYLENYSTNKDGLPATDNERLRAPENITDALVQGRGYWVYFFGDIATDSKYNDPLPDTLDVSGQEWNGNGTEVDFGVTYTTTADSGWNFIGNPFGATINWSDASKWTKTNISSTIYVWDPAANSGNGEYLTWNGTTGTLGNGLISPFQGFWVKANNISPVLRVKKTGKTTGGNFIRKEVQTIAPVIELEASINGRSKRTNIMFNESGSRGIDNDDGYRLLPFADTRIDFFSLLDDGTQIAINNQPLNFTNRIKIPLILDSYSNGDGNTGTYTIRWSGLRGIHEEWIITLIDNATGERINLLDQESYTLNHSTNGKAMSNSNPSSPNYKLKTTSGNIRNRFTLQISTEEIEANIPEQIYLEQNYPNPFNPSTVIPFGLDDFSDVELTIYDILGRKVQTLIRENKAPGRYEARFNAGDLASGVYFYRLITNNKTFVKRFTLIK